MVITDNLPEKLLNNPAYANILTRTSIRQYTSEPISDIDVSALLHAGMSAPSGVNKQPWEFIAVDKRELLDALANALPYAKMTAHAPLAIVVCGNRNRFLEGVDDNLWEQDCSAATENILLAAHALGLGAVWTCLYPHTDRMEAAARLLDIPDDIIPFNLIPIGHPEKEHEPMDKWHADRVHINSYGKNSFKLIQKC